MKKVFFLLLGFIIFSSCFVSAVDNKIWYGRNESAPSQMIPVLLTSEGVLRTDMNFSVADIWNTNIGKLTDVNSTQFENVLDALNIDESWLDSLFFRLDGSSTMAGSANFGGFRAINLSEPIDLSDAATKNYSDSNNFWNRSGSEISTRFENDNLLIGGNVTVRNDNVIYNSTGATIDFSYDENMFTTTSISPTPIPADITESDGYYITFTSGTYDGQSFNIIELSDSEYFLINESIDAVDGETFNIIAPIEINSNIYIDGGIFTNGSSNFTGSTYFAGDVGFKELLLPAVLYPGTGLGLTFDNSFGGIDFDGNDLEGIDNMVVSAGSGVIYFGTFLSDNSIGDGEFTGDWNFNGGEISNATYDTIDFGTNTITDGEFTGDWNFNGGEISNATLADLDMTGDLDMNGNNIVDVSDINLDGVFGSDINMANGQIKDASIVNTLIASFGNPSIRGVSNDLIFRTINSGESFKFLYHNPAIPVDNLILDLSYSGGANFQSTNIQTTGTISDGVATLSNGALTSMGDITGTDVDISAGTGDITTSGNLTVTGSRTQLSGNSWICDLPSGGIVLTSNLTKSILDGDC